MNGSVIGNARVAKVRNLCRERERWKRCRVGPPTWNERALNEWRGARRNGNASSSLFFYKLSNEREILLKGEESERDENEERGMNNHRKEQDLIGAR